MARKYTTAQSTVLRRLLDGWPESAVNRGELQVERDGEPRRVKNHHHDSCTRARTEIIMFRNMVDASGPGGYRHESWRIAANGHAWRVL